MAATYRSSLVDTIRKMLNITAFVGIIKWEIFMPDGREEGFKNC